MTARRNQIKAMETKQLIFDTAMKLFNKNGYNNVKLIDIARIAEVSISTLYKYYPLKSDLLKQSYPTVYDRLYFKIENFPESMSTKEKILDIMLEGAKNRQCDTFVLARKLILDDIFRSKERHDKAIQHYKGAEAVYEYLLSGELKAGKLKPETDIVTIASVITAISLTEFDYAVFNKNYDYANTYAKKLDVLLAGHLTEEFRA
jgi:AcrR family transcriptional regulator